MHGSGRCEGCMEGAGGRGAWEGQVGGMHGRGRWEGCMGGAGGRDAWEGQVGGMHGSCVYMCAVSTCVLCPHVCCVHMCKEIEYYQQLVVPILCSVKA